MSNLRYIPSGVEGRGALPVKVDLPGNHGRCPSNRGREPPVVGPWSNRGAGDGRSPPWLPSGTSDRSDTPLSFTPNPLRRENGASRCAPPPRTSWPTVARSVRACVDGLAGQVGRSAPPRSFTGQLLTKSYTYRHGPHVSVRRIVANDLDAEAVVAVITGTALCGNCIARNTGIARWRVGDALQRRKAVVKIHSNTGVCGGCQQRVLVHRTR